MTLSPNPSHLWHDLGLKTDSIIWKSIKIKIFWLSVQFGDTSFDLVINKLFGLVIVYLKSGEKTFDLVIDKW